LHVTDFGLSVLCLILFEIFGALLSVACYTFTTLTQMQWDPNDPYHAEELQKVFTPFCKSEFPVAALTNAGWREKI
jgi:hypothetical protein